MTRRLWRSAQLPNSQVVCQETTTNTSAVFYAVNLQNIFSENQRKRKGWKRDIGDKLVIYLLVAKQNQLMLPGTYFICIPVPEDTEGLWLHHPHPTNPFPHFARLSPAIFFLKCPISVLFCFYYLLGQLCLVLTIRKRLFPSFSGLPFFAFG